MTKQKISITIDKQTLALVEQILGDEKFRNRSHVLEYSLKRYLDKSKLIEEGI
jgi:Arc/MetJ-type ribon-helix-helix transcriptional regulator